MSNVLRAEKPTRSQPALKLVKTHDLSRDQWLTVRKGGIGSSDAASADAHHRKLVNSPRAVTASPTAV